MSAKASPGAGLITATNLSVTFTLQGGAAELPVLRDVTFEIARGSFTAIVGPSGCGKTTLLNCIGGLTGGRGSLTVDGKSPDLCRRQRYFGLVPQDPCLFEWRTVRENVLLPHTVFGHRLTADRLDHIDGLIRLVGLAGFEDEYPAALSGGMRQRVSLARALSFEPPVLLLDEPFGALDAQTREDMNLEVLRIWAEVKSTVVMITHDVAEAALLADRVFVMTQRPATIREVVEIALPRPRSRDLLDSGALTAYTRRLRQALRPSTAGPSAIVHPPGRESA